MRDDVFAHDIAWQCPSLHFFDSQAAESFTLLISYPEVTSTTLRFVRHEIQRCGARQIDLTSRSWMHFFFLFVFKMIICDIGYRIAEGDHIHRGVFSSYINRCMVEKMFILWPSDFLFIPQVISKNLNCDAPRTYIFFNLDYWWRFFAKIIKLLIYKYMLVI